MVVLNAQGLYDEVKQLFAQSHHGEDEPLLAKVAAALGVSAVGITFANPSDVVKASVVMLRPPSPAMETSSSVKIQCS